MADLEKLLEEINYTTTIIELNNMDSNFERFDLTDLINRIIIIRDYFSSNKFLYKEKEKISGKIYNIIYRAIKKEIVKEKTSRLYAELKLEDKLYITHLFLEEIKEELEEDKERQRKFISQIYSSIDTIVTLETLNEYFGTNNVIRNHEISKPRSVLMGTNNNTKLKNTNLKSNFSISDINFFKYRIKSFKNKYGTIDNPKVELLPKGKYNTTHPSVVASYVTDSGRYVRLHFRVENNEALISNLKNNPISLIEYVERYMGISTDVFQTFKLLKSLFSKCKDGKAENFECDFEYLEDISNLKTSSDLSENGNLQRIGIVYNYSDDDTILFSKGTTNYYSNSLKTLSDKRYTKELYFKYNNKVKICASFNKKTDACIQCIYIVGKLLDITLISKDNIPDLDDKDIERVYNLYESHFIKYSCDNPELEIYNINVDSVICTDPRSLSVDIENFKFFIDNSMVSTDEFFNLLERDKSEVREYNAKVLDNNRKKEVEKQVELWVRSSTKFDDITRHERRKYRKRLFKLYNDEYDNLY